MNSEIEEIKLTPHQAANKRYYERMKFDPVYIAKRRAGCKKNYDKIKNNDEFKLKVSIQKKEYYEKKKGLGILLPDIL